MRSGIARAFFLCEKMLQDRKHSGRSLKILFSEKPLKWQKVIRKGFRFSKHRITFDAFTAVTIGKYDLVVPLNVTDLEFLDRNRQLVLGNAIPIPSLDSVQLCDDKYLFNQTLTEKGYGKLIPKVSGPMSFPYILKKKKDAWGKNCFIIYGPEQEQQYAEHLHDENFFVQEMIAGFQEYATHILYKDGKIQCSLNIEYTFDFDLPIKGQDMKFSRAIVPCPYLDTFAGILKLIEFEGLCCFNYKVRDGQAMILEINPRFGGSLCQYFISFVRHLDLKQDDRTDRVDVDIKHKSANRIPTQTS